MCGLSHRVVELQDSTLVQFQTTAKRQSLVGSQGIAHLQYTTYINGGGSSQRTLTTERSTLADGDSTSTCMFAVDDERTSSDVGCAAIDISTGQAPHTTTLLLYIRSTLLTSLRTVVNNTIEGFVSIGRTNDIGTLTCSLDIKAREEGTLVARQTANVTRGLVLRAANLCITLEVDGGILDALPAITLTHSKLALATLASAIDYYMACKTTPVALKVFSYPVYFPFQRTTA